jgi:3-hydroxyacyl-[acyl-carrier-protein] dehydratase
MQESLIDINQISKMIPHRYPFLLVDKVIAINEGKGIVALKNVTMNEQFFVGHFPQKPIMPGVLIIESMAQAAAVFVAHELKDTAGLLVYLAAIEGARFRKPVVPGDALHLHINKISSRRNIWKMEGEAHVDGEKVAEATFSAVIVNE